jgi:hypothetical protein
MGVDIRRESASIGPLDCRLGTHALALKGTVPDERDADRRSGAVIAAALDRRIDRWLFATSSAALRTWCAENDIEILDASGRR